MVRPALPTAFSRSNHCVCNNKEQDMSDQSQASQEHMEEREVDLGGAAAEQAKPAKKKRFWEVTDKFGQPINPEHKARLQGASPFQAVLKAVTRYAEGEEHFEFWLREINGRRSKTGKFKLHHYEGWKQPLKPHERSGFTATKNIAFKPRAKWLGNSEVDVLRVITPKAQAAPGEIEIEV